jgi:hypothetical protein
MRGERTFGSSFVRKSLSSSPTEYLSPVMTIYWYLRLHLDVLGGLWNVVGYRRPRWGWVEGLRRLNWEILGEYKNVK